MYNYFVMFCLFYGIITYKNYFFPFLSLIIAFDVVAQKREDYRTVDSK